MVFFDTKSPKFDTIQARLMGKNNKALEITLSEILIAENRVPVIKKLNKILSDATRYKVKVILSSGAHNIYEIRAPRDIASVIKTLLGIKIDICFEMLRENPINIIFESKEKRSKGFVMPGLKVIGKGKPYEVKKKILDFLS